jgi:hypothetical protein
MKPSSDLNSSYDKIKGSTVWQCLQKLPVLYMYTSEDILGLGLLGYVTGTPFYALSR